jgi:hypothetical protein
MIAAVVVAVVVAVAIVAVAVLAGGDDDGAGAGETTTRDLTPREAVADRACRARFSVGFSRAFADDACPFYVPHALAGATNDEIIAMPQFRIEICVEAGRIRYESGEVATRLDYEAWLDTVRVDCRREIRGS